MKKDDKAFFGLKSRRDTLLGAGKLGLAVVGTASLSRTKSLAPFVGRAFGETPARWATGGTAVMTRNYPDPFINDTSPTCTMTCAQILGPCYAPTQVRSDISEGHAGIPVRLALRVVNEQCEPVEGATVDIWHAAPEGIYSGQVENDMCNKDDSAARHANYFRGVQTTDANGRVDFDTCFPGWYSGRAVHIHFTIRIGNSEYVTSQVYFDDDLVTDIVTNYSDYSARGKNDTTNKTDGVVSPDEIANYIVSTARMPDGAMQAWKTLVIRNSLDEILCHAKPGRMPPGPHPVL